MTIGKMVQLKELRSFTKELPWLFLSATLPPLFVTDLEDELVFIDGVAIPTRSLVLRWPRFRNRYIVEVMTKKENYFNVSCFYRNCKNNIFQVLDVSLDVKVWKQSFNILSFRFDLNYVEFGYTGLVDYSIVHWFQHCHRWSQWHFCDISMSLISKRSKCKELARKTYPKSRKIFFIE